jgi:hypothetical protein
MKRILIPLVFVVVAGGLLWMAVAGLETGPAAQDEPPAVIMRAPPEFDVEKLGESGLASSASALMARPGLRPGVEFSDNGARVILLIDRQSDRLIELRASRTGTIVERTWPGSVEKRLGWASSNGSLEAPGLEPATGKNLYH